MCTLTAWADGEIYYGIYQGSGTLTGYGTGKAETYDVAIHLTDPSLVGMEIRAIRIPVNTGAKNATDYKGWLTRELTLVSGKIVPDIVSVETTPSGSWAEARLSEPYVIEEGGLYVGYSLNISSVDASNTSDANKTPIMTTATENPEGLLIHTSRTYRKWVGLAEVGSPAVVVLIGGENIKPRAATLVAPDDLYTTTGSTISTTLTLVNHGSEAISNIEYQIEANGVTTTRQLTRSLAGQYYGRSTTFTATIPAVDTKGSYPTTFRVTKINGEANEDPVGATTVPVTYLDEIPVHRPLVEEYTGTWCQWCPRGLACFERMTDLYGDKFVGVAYHMSDVMDFAVSYYPIGTAEVGLPTAFIDRAANYDLSDGRQAWQQRSNGIAPASIDVVAEWADDSKTKIKATSTTTFVRDFNDNTCLVGYVLLANDLHKDGDSDWYQSNAFSGNQGYSTGDKYLQKYIDSPNPMKNFHFDHVAIAQSANYGVGREGSLPASVKEYEPNQHVYTFDISGITLPLDKEKLEVVAVLVDSKTGQVVNCNKGHVTDADGINEVQSSKSKVQSELYDLAGRRIMKPAKGIYIENGKKVIK